MFRLKHDKFRKLRGGYSRLLDLSCANCKSHLFFYQKDGPGILKRLYLDRIFDLKNSNEQLNCSNCGKYLGTQIIFEKENRPAYKLLSGSVSKKIRKTVL